MEVVNILAILKRRGQVSVEEFAQFYKKGDEIASITYGLQQATFEAEAKQSPHSFHEADVAYEVSDELGSPL